MTLQQVAEVLGMSRQGLYFHIQQGDKVSLEILIKIAEVLGCSVQDFFYNENEETGINIKCPHCGKKITIGKGE
jgi:DNA-binding XRE family transcriptional regulator